MAVTKNFSQIVNSGSKLCSVLPFFSVDNFEFLFEIGDQTLSSLNNSCFQHLKKVCKNELYNRLNFALQTESNFNQSISKSDCNIKLSIFHQNICSLNANHSKLQQFLYGLNMEFDVIVLSEIRATNINFYNNIFLNYSFFYDLPADSDVGGVGIYVSNRIECTERPDLKLEGCNKNKIENLWLQLNKENCKFILGGLYRHPHGDIKEFSKKIEKNLEIIARNRVPCILSGDLNIDLMKADVHNDTSNYLNMLLMYNFLPTILMPTRITGHSSTLIDHIYFYQGDLSKYSECKSGSFLTDITDHLPNYLIVMQNRGIKEDNARLKIRLFTVKNKLKFSTALSQINWEAKFSSNNNVNEVYNIFHEEIKHLFNSNFPITKLSRKGERNKTWITTGLKISSNKKNCLYKKWIKSKNLMDEIKYKEYKKVFEKLSNFAEITYYRELFSSKTTTIKKMWKHINELCSNKTVKKVNINNIIIDNIEISDAQKIADEMNKYFCNVGKVLSSNLPPPVTHFKDYMENSKKNSMFCDTVDYEELAAVIDNLNSKKSPGYDEVGPSLVKQSASGFITPLLYIYNLSFLTGVVPDKLKISKVIPIFKKGDAKIMSNYRPISLLSIFNKIMEKLIHKRMVAFLDKYSILYKHQFGFRKYHSTTLALIETLDQIYTWIDKGETVIGTYFDVQKAFDAVDHNILLTKLYNIGIRGNLYEWFKSYLSERKQFVVSGGKNSIMSLISYGVPQGSVLGPLLFIIYMNDLQISVPGYNIKLFADDTNLFTHGINIQNLMKETNDVLDCLSKWFISNKLSLHVEKTCFSLFTKKKLIPQVCLKINDIKIKRVASSKYLGLNIDDKLSWREHIKYILRKITCFSGIFYKIREKMPFKCLRAIYFSMIYPHILYGIELYANAHTTYLESLCKANNRLLRILQNKKIRTPTNELYQNFNTFKIPKLFEINILTFMHKYHHHNSTLPAIYHNYFTCNLEIHKHFTRQQENLHQQYFRTNTGQRSILYKGVKLWNALDSNLKNVMSVKMFVRKIKKKLSLMM